MRRSNSKKNISARKDFLETIESLNRFTRIGKKMSGAYSCCIFLPAGFPEIVEAQDLQLVSYDSDSNNIKADIYLDRLTNSITLASRQKTTIQLSSVSSKLTLDYYSKNEDISTFLALPVQLSIDNNLLTGVFTVDSRDKEYFARGEIEIITDLVKQIEHLLNTSITKIPEKKPLDFPSFDEFLDSASSLVDTLGIESIDLLVIETPQNLATKKHQNILKLFKSIQKSLPNQFPKTVLLSGQIIVLVDSLMSLFFLNKLETVLKNESLKRQNYTDIKLKKLSSYHKPDDDLESLLNKALDDKEEISSASLRVSE